MAPLHIYTTFFNSQSFDFDSDFDSVFISIKLIDSPKGKDGKGVYKFQGLNVGGTTTYLHSNRFLTHNGMQKKIRFNR